MESKGLVIKSLYINNFKAYAPQEGGIKIDFFDINARKLDFMILSGFNGYGKTSIFQAIEFVLSGKIDLFDYKDKNRKFEENIIINDLSKESFVAIELIETTTKKIHTIVRYTKKGKAGKGTDYKSETKDYDAYILEKEFKYDEFISQVSKGEIKCITKKNIEDLLGEKSIDEWINQNYIRQEYASNILFKTDADRLNFINQFIETVNEKNFQKFIQERKMAEENINKLSDEVNKLYKNTNKKKFDNIGEEPENEKLQLEDNAVWDKDKYNDDEDFENYIKRVERIKELFKYLDQYTSKYILDLSKKLLLNEVLIKQMIIANYSEETRDKYIENYNRCEYLRKLISNKDEFLKNEIEDKYLEEDWKKTIKELQKMKKDLDEKSAKSMKLYNKVKEFREDITKESDSFFDIFGDICPVCGCDYTSNGRKTSLKESINQYKDLFDEYGTILDEALNSISDKIGKEYEELKTKIEEFIKKFDTSHFIKSSIENINKDLMKYNDCKKSVEFILGEDKFEFSQDLEEKSINSDSEKLIKKIKHIQKVNEDSLKNFITNNYNEVIYNENKKYLSKLIKVDYEKFKEKITKKIKYLKWKDSEKQFNLLSSNKSLLIKKEEELKLQLIKKNKINKILNTVAESKKNYLNDIIKNIEIPLYIYSGKLIQTHQNGLGIFCFTGAGDDSLTQFKLTIDGKSTGHDIVNKFSSGQKAVVNVSLMLAFRKVIDSKFDIFMIDDPCQSMDDINIASLTEILKNEFNNTQIILSTHEDEIAGYMSYKFKKIDKNVRIFNVQKELYKINLE